MKGYHGETCAEAIRDVMEPGHTLSFSELFSRVKKKGDWRDETIWQDIMAHVVNLPPAQLHWPFAKPFLLVHEDGTFELYDAKKHPKVKE